jgi:hypothetical protein
MCSLLIDSKPQASRLRIPAELHQQIYQNTNAAQRHGKPIW